MNDLKKHAGNVLVIALGVTVGLIIHDQVSGMLNKWKTNAPGK